MEVGRNTPAAVQSTSSAWRRPEGPSWISTQGGSLAYMQGATLAVARMRPLVQAVSTTREAATGAGIAPW
jgi:glutamate/tyrosine decarboxylase-like PLP-dependent enzyme